VTSDKEFKLKSESKLPDAPKTKDHLRSYSMRQSANAP